MEFLKKLPTENIAFIMRRLITSSKDKVLSKRNIKECITVRNWN